MKEMKVVGTIVEYNPLHNGHAYAIAQIKKQSNAEQIVAVLSGNFTMRGELSLFDKFEKTKQALKNGIDVIIELPFVYAVQNSDLFANFSIQLLMLAQVDEIWIGSESNDPSLYEKAYKAWKKPDNQQKIRDLLDQGLSYKAATASILPLLSNDLLGYSYYKALQEKDSKIPLKTIQRVGAGYFDSIPNQFASAYAIRQDLSLMQTYCPDFVQGEIRDQNKLFELLKYRVLSTSTKELEKIFLVEEGMEHKIVQIQKYTNLNDYVSSFVSKRYTKSRIQRMLCYVLFNITKDEVKEIFSREVSFLRILGASQKGLRHLQKIKKDVCLYTNIKNGLHPILDIELRITDILDMVYQTELKPQEQGKPLFLD